MRSFVAVNAIGLVFLNLVFRLPAHDECERLEAGSGQRRCPHARRVWFRPFWIVELSLREAKPEQAVKQLPSRSTEFPEFPIRVIRAQLIEING